MPLLTVWPDKLVRLTSSVDRQ